VGTPPDRREHTPDRRPPQAHPDRRPPHTRTAAHHHAAGRAREHTRTAAHHHAEARREGQWLRMTSRTSPAVSLGVLPTRTPTFSSASFLAPAVPADPEMIAPA
jgi:hypothetical protein